MKPRDWLGLIVIGVVLGELPSEITAAEETINAVQLDMAPTIDGTIGDPEWGSAVVLEGFVQIEPDFGVQFDQGDTQLAEFSKVF